MEKINSLPQDKQAMLDKWKASGKNIKQYCIDENIGYHTMSYWHRKEKYLATGKDKKFIKVKIKEVPIADQSKTELIFNNGNRILFHYEVNMMELKHLVR